MGRKKEKKNSRMNIKKKISKKLVMQLALFAVVIGIATLFDIYFDNKQVEIEEIEANSSDDEKEPDTILLISQSSNLGAKTSVNKTVVRKLQLKSQDKFIQKYYQLRNFQVLKAELQTQTTPLISSYHFLAFKNYFYSIPDDVPLNS
jgi:cell division protein FtsL